jgi:thioredoxin 1
LGVYFFTSEGEKEVTRGMPIVGEDVEEMIVEDTSSNNSYQEYSPSKLGLVEKGKVLLFFHANWCPICRAMETEILNNANIIPDNVFILKVNYDKEIALRQKYAVTIQHTFVELGKDGNMVGKFSDARNLDDIISKIK